MGFLAGFVDAIAGGGGLISLPALIYTGMPVVEILGTNKFQSSIGTGIAVINYYKNDLIDLSTVWRGLLFGFIGAISGALAATYISNQFMRYIVPFFMLFIFVYNLFKKQLGIKPTKEKLNPIIFFSIFGLILGFYDAFFGPGTGNFWIIAIVYFLGYTFLKASGYAKVLNLKSNLFSLVIFLYYGHVQFTLGIVMAIGNLCGGYIGSQSVILNGSKLVRPIFIIVVFINVILSFYQLIFSKNVNIGL